MSKRHPTAEEILLWREINRNTRKNPDIAEEPLVPNPSPCKGEAGRGTSGTLGPKTDNGPIPALPRKERDKPPLAPLATREAKKRLNLHAEIDARLDLHGYSRIDAYTLVHAFIAHHYARGDRHLVIIPGKGRSGEGVLRTELPHWLNEPVNRRMVSAFFNAGERSGGAGVVHVMLKKSSTK